MTGMSPSAGPRFMTVKEASEFCMVSTETIRRWIRNNELKAFNTRGHGVTKILYDDLRSFAERQNMLTAEQV